MFGPQQLRQTSKKILRDFEGTHTKKMKSGLPTVYANSL